MSYIPTFEEAEKLLKQYNKQEFHLNHAYTLAGIMRYFAQQYDPEKAEYWAVVGLLHDIDFEMYPDEHCIKAKELLEAEGVDKGIIRAVQSHGYGLTNVDIAPEHIMEKILFAADELSGLIWASALVRPSKSVMDLEVKSVMKKYKTPAFAAGCSREIIAKGADMLGWSLEELIQKTIEAMRELEKAN